MLHTSLFKKIVFLGTLVGASLAHAGFEYHVPLAGLKPTQETPAAVVPSSCKELLANNPSSPSGTYLIDVDGVGGQEPFSAYCDMTSDGGGWTRVVAQYEATPVPWTGGTNGASEVLAATQIPAHTHTAFGKDNVATFIDYVPFTYTTGDIATTQVTSQKTGTSYHIFRSATSRYDYHDPDSTYLTSPAWANQWNSLTFDKTPGRSFTWTFLLPHSDSRIRGFALNGSFLESTAETFAWTVWVR